MTILALLRVSPSSDFEVHDCSALHECLPAPVFPSDRWSLLFRVLTGFVHAKR